MSFLIEQLSVDPENWYFALSVCAIAGFAGVLAGLLYRVSAAIFLCFVSLLATTLISINQGWPFWQSLLWAFGVVAAVQLGYFVGVAVTSLRVRAGSHASRRTVHETASKRDIAG